MDFFCLESGPDESRVAFVPVFNDKHTMLFGKPVEHATRYEILDRSQWSDVTSIYKGVIQHDEETKDVLPSLGREPEAVP